MKTESTVKYILRLALTLLAITSVVAGALAAVNGITAPIIRQLNEEKTLQAVSAVLPDAASAQPLTAYTDSTGLVKAVYESDSGYAVTVTPSGFDGEIEMMVGISKETGAVLGISVINQTETAGLGAVCAAKTGAGEAFRGQFIGATDTVTVTKDGGTMDAITGATITSRAVSAGVSAALSFVKSLG